jgi:hypothetical protein
VVRSNRRENVKTEQKAARVHLLQSLAVCAHYGRRLRIQTPKNFPTYYREDSHLRGYYDCPDSGQSIHADDLDAQIAAIVQPLKLTANLEQEVRQLLHEDQEGSDPEAERKEIRAMMRMMRENYEHGLYEGEEFQYWQKINSLKEKLDLLSRVPENTIDKAARTLLNLRESWEWATKEKRKMLVRSMIQEVGCDVSTKKIVLVKVNPDFEILFRIMDYLIPDNGRKYLVRTPETNEANCINEEDKGQMGVEVKISGPMSHNA